MAELPDPTETLKGDDRAIFDHKAAARSHAEGRSQLGDVYVRMFNNPGWRRRSALWANTCASTACWAARSASW